MITELSFRAERGICSRWERIQGCCLKNRAAPGRIAEGGCPYAMWKPKPEGSKEP
jgi:hypothetical protein